MYLKLSSDACAFTSAPLSSQVKMATSAAAAERKDPLLGYLSGKTVNPPPVVVNTSGDVVKVVQTAPPPSGNSKASATTPAHARQQSLSTPPPAFVPALKLDRASLADGTGPRSASSVQSQGAQSDTAKLLEHEAKEAALLLTPENVPVVRKKEESQVAVISCANRDRFARFADLVLFRQAIALDKHLQLEPESVEAEHVR